MKTLKDHLIPHKGNSHMPTLFAAESIGMLMLFVLLFQMLFVVHTAVLKNSNFLAAVLPTVLVTMTNADRAEAGVSTVTSDVLLARAAQLKADDMAAKSYFAHVDPQGRQPWHWFDEVGYIYSYAGENLAVDFSESVDVEKAWMNSPAHKANIMKEKFTKVGIGVAKGMYKGKETTFVVQFFATPPSAPVIIPDPVVAVTTPKIIQPEVTPIPVPSKETPQVEEVIAEEVIPEPVTVPAEELFVIAVEDAAPVVSPEPSTVIENTEIAQAESPLEIGADQDAEVLGVAFEPAPIIDETVLYTEPKEAIIIAPEEVGNEAIQQRTKESWIASLRFTKTDIKNTIMKVTTSPSTWYMALLVTIFAVLGAVFIIALHIHITKREVEGISLALFTLLILAGLVNFNFGPSHHTAEVPSDGASASVVLYKGM